MEQDNGLIQKRSHESLSFPIMGGAGGLMRDEYEEERAKVIKEQADSYLKWYQKEY